MSPEKQYKLVTEILCKIGADFSRDYFTDINNRKRHKRQYSKVYGSIIAQHFNHERTIALPPYKHSKVVWIDIDELIGDTNNERIRFAHSILSNLFNYHSNSIISEFRKDYKASHHWVLLSEYVTPAWIEYAKKFIKEFFLIDIEIKGINNQEMRLPYSKRYPNLGIFDRTEENSFTKFITSDNILTDLHQFFTNNLNIVNVADHSKKYLNNFKKRKIKAKRNKNSNIDYTKSNVNIEYLKEKFPITKGNRFFNSCKLATYLFLRNYNYSEFKETLLQLSTNSKDLKKKNKDKYIQDSWNQGVKYVLNTNNNTSNKPVDDKSIIDTYSVDCDYIIQKNGLSKDKIYTVEAYLKKIIVFKGIAKQQKVINRIANDATKLLSELHGKLDYMNKNNYHYAQNKKFLEGSVCLSIDLLKKIAKKLNLKNPILLKRLLVDSRLISIVRDKSGYSHSYKGQSFACHYRIAIISNYSKLISNFLHISHDSGRGWDWTATATNPSYLSINYINKFENNSYSFEEDIGYL